MPTILDSFVVSIGLDPTNYNKGRKQVREDFQKTKEEARQTGATLEEEGKRGAGFFSAIRNEALTTFATLVGANSLRQFVSSSITDLARMDRTARATGASVKQLDTYVSAIVRNGGDVNAATASFSGLAQAMEQLRVTGNSPILPVLNRIGGGRNDTPQQLLEKLGAFQDRTGDNQRTAMYGNMLGFDEASIDLAIQGKDAVHAAMVESERLGVATDAQAKKAREAQAAWRELIQTLTNGGRGIVTDLLPGLTGVVEKLADITAQAPKTSAVIATLLGSGLAIGGFKGLVAMTRLLFGGGAGAATAAVAEGGAAVAGGAGAALAAPLAGALAFGGAMAYGGGMGKSEDQNYAAHQAYAYFKSKGYSDAQARGIAAGIFAEGGHATALNPTSGAFGAGQWLGSRKQGLFARYGSSPNLMQQFEYMDYELRGGDAGGKSVLGATTEQGAMQAYITNFMRPVPAGASAAERERILDGEFGRGGSWLSANRASSSAPTRGSILIDHMTVNTQATDAKGIARDMLGALTTQANSGLGG